MTTNHKDKKKMNSGRQILSLIHRFIEFIAKGIFTLAAYIGGPVESQPPIKDLTLLHNATTLALKIRNKQVCKPICNICIYIIIYVYLSTVSRSSIWFFFSFFSFFLVIFRGSSEVIY